MKEVLGNKESVSKSLRGKVDALVVCMHLNHVTGNRNRSAWSMVVLPGIDFQFITVVEIG